MTDPHKRIHTLQRAAQAFRDTPGRQGRFVAIAGARDVLVAGDLHGHLDNFKRVLEIAQLDRRERRHLVVQELIHGPHRYPNGGEGSHRLVELLAALKCQYPDRVHYLLGNHELSQWTKRAIMKGDDDLNQLYLGGLATAYGNAGAAVYTAHEAIFASLPVVLRLDNRVLISHSLPNAKRLANWELAQLARHELDEDAYKLGGCVHAVVWGRDLDEESARSYLRKTDADVLVSGHVPCDDGYQTPNGLQLILDAKDQNGCCCLVPAERPVGFQDLLKGVIRLHARITS